jgi:choline dehydrogenase-like flavoprotein
MNIKPIIKLKGVGQNLQDHMSVALFYERQNAGPLHRRMRVDRIGLDLVKAYLFGKGIANDLPAGCMAFLRTDASQAIPDVQFLFNAAPLAAQPYLAPFVKPYKDGFATRVVGLRPESRGTIALRSNDPLAAPIIKQNFFAHDNDILTLRRGVRLAQEVARQTALKPFIKRALSLCDDNSDQAVDDYIRSTAITVHHPLGTCKMSGRDDDGVVDAELKVRGIKDLRVVDASIMPDLIGGNINAAVMMIAEKAADLILNAD